MTYIEFSQALGGGWYDKINATCQVDGCNNIESIQKGSALRNFQRNGIFKCRTCCFTKEGRKLISKATSYKRSEKTKEQMSESAGKKWQTEWGVKQRKILANKAIQQHASINMDKSKRKVLYISAKNNAIRTCNSSYEYIFCEYYLEKD